MRHQIRTSVVLATALLALGLTGCGDDAEDLPRGTDLSKADLEERVTSKFEPDDPGKKLETDCEGALEAVADATQDCRVTTGRDEAVGVRAVTKDIDADDLGMVLTPFLYGEDVAGAIASSLEIQGYTGVETSCDGMLVGEVGRTLSCDLSTPDGDTKVNVDVTSVEGLMINFDFKSA